MTKANPQLGADSSAINTWGYELLSEGRVRDALPLMQLAAQIGVSGYPYMGLGETHERLADKPNAITAYREALKRDPQNIIARQRLEELAP